MLEALTLAVVNTTTTSEARVVLAGFPFGADLAHAFALRDGPKHLPTR